MNRKINVLLIIETEGPGGAETVLLDIARYLDRNRFNPYVVLMRKGWLYDQLVKNDIPTEHIPSHRAWDLSFIKKLIRFCRRQKIDVIHSHFLGTNLYSCMAGVILRKPVVATFHNELDFSGWTVKYGPLKYFLVRTLAAKVVLVARFMVGDYKNKAKFPERKLVTVYNGIS